MTLRWVKNRGRELRYRLAAASKWEFGINVVNIAAKTYQIYFLGVVYPLARLANRTITVNELLCVVGAMCYTTIYPFLPKTTKKKWIQEEVRRAKSLGVAVSRLASEIDLGELTDVSSDRIIQGLLVSIRSEVEAIVVDTEGIYINVNLLMPHPTEETKLVVKNRANLDRDLDVPYDKSNLVVWRAMETKKAAYEPNFESKGEKPYRCILAFPIVFERSDGTIIA